MSLPAEVNVRRSVTSMNEAVAKDGKLRQCVTPEANAAFYQDWSKAYDNDVSIIGYNGPLAAAEGIRENLEKRDARILDVAAGTGLVAKHLRDMGYTNLDALDPSSEMLERAREQSLYKKYICEFLTSDPTNGIADNSYDGVVSSGSFSEGHLKCDVLRELIRIVKPGGYIVWAMREEYLTTKEEYKRLEPLMERLDREGLWVRLDRRNIEHYYKGHPGLVYVNRVQ